MYWGGVGGGGEGAILCGGGLAAQGKTINGLWFGGTLLNSRGAMACLTVALCLIKGKRVTEEGGPRRAFDVADVGYIGGSVAGYTNTPKHRCPARPTLQHGATLSDLTKSGRSIPQHSAIQP